MVTLAYRILIVDDVMDNLLLLQTVLESEGYEVDTADNGYRAIAKVESAPPDLILMDVMMPEMNGYEVTRRIRQMPQIATVPIVLVTAYEDQELVECFNSGANACLRKPIDLDELLTRVKASLPMREMASTQLHSCPGLK